MPLPWILVLVGVLLVVAFGVLTWRGRSRPAPAPLPPAGDLGALGLSAVRPASSEPREPVTRADSVPEAQGPEARAPEALVAELTPGPDDPDPWADPAPLVGGETVSAVRPRTAPPAMDPTDALLGALRSALDLDAAALIEQRGTPFAVEAVAGTRRGLARHSRLRLADGLLDHAPLVLSGTALKEADLDGEGAVLLLPLGMPGTALVLAAAAAPSPEHVGLALRLGAALDALRHGADPVEAEHRTGQPEPPPAEGPEADASEPPPSEHGASEAAASEPDPAPRSRTAIVADEMDGARAEDGLLALALVYRADAEAVAAESPTELADAESALAEVLETTPGSDRVVQFGELTYGVFLYAGREDVEAWAERVHHDTVWPVLVGVAVLQDEHETGAAFRAAATEALHQAYADGPGSTVIV